ncbi:MAG: hypothetical protein J3Q66DRAFT_406151 [Benniella sp.]|nr:MAG: hypothetical protein J3Q66DRAFT_406151 [Benniella sp.]
MSSGKSSVGRRPKTLAWSLLCSLVALQSALSVQAALQPGFCGDCQTFSNAIGVCGGTFTEADITAEYTLELQSPQNAKCICTSSMQSVLWKCASCMSLGGKPFKSPPPNKFQTTCMKTFNITAAEYNAPYTGVVAPDTQGLVGDGTPAPPVLPNNPTPPPTQPGTGGNGNGNGNGGNGNGNGGNGNGGSGGSGSQPSADIPVPSSNADTATSESTSTGPSSTVIGAAAGVVGVAMFAGMFAVVAMKRRRRRHTPLDLDSLPGHGLDDKWDKPHLPPSPALHPAPPAMPPAHVSGAVRGGGYDGGQGYAEGSVVGGYDNYDNYDQYRGGPGAYDQYGGQYPNQYGDQQYGGYHGQDGYDYGYEGYDNGPNAKPTAFHTGDAGRGAQAQGQGQYL